VVWSLDASQQALSQLEQAVSRQEWDRALTVARRVRTWPAAARLDLTRALFHAGRLPEDLFTFPKPGDWTSFRVMTRGWRWRALRRKRFWSWAR